MDQAFFDTARDALEGFVVTTIGRPRTWAHSRGLKVWFTDETREHYEAQLIRVEGEAHFEIGFHAEHPKPALNDAVLQRLLAVEPKWRKVLGPDAVAGEFIGRAGWRRISELWPVPDAGVDDDAEAIDIAIEVAARLADYVRAIEPLRT